MTTRIERSFQLHAPVDRVLEVMRDPRVIEESERSRDALSVAIRELARTETRHEYEIHVVSPKRTVTGIDRTKTENNRTRVVWDLSRRSGQWTWSGDHGPAVKISGTYRLTPDGDDTVLVLTAEIQVGIPIAGRVVEKKIEDGFLGQWPGYTARIERAARAQAG